MYTLHYKIKPVDLYFMKNKKLSNILNKNGNSLMEFAVTIGLMAILAATAAPKLSQMGENTRIAKSRTELDKLARQAANFYQETAIKEGREDSQSR